MAVLLIGTLDTKGEEVGFVRDQLRLAGVEVCVVDAGVLGPPLISPDIPREEVFRAAGTTFDAVLQARDRGQAVEAAARGAARLAVERFQQGLVEGVLGLGGSAGTTIATAAMRALPFGIPKLMVSTLASGQVAPYVGVRDIAMLHSVVDLSGLNRISRVVLTNAAQAMIGMVRAKGEAPPAMADRPLITATMFGVTTPCVEAARRGMEAAGYEVLVFHATGTGGRTMESFIRDGLVTGVLDLTTTELADELVGGILSAGRDRLTAAGLQGVPQVISLGALDMVNFGPPDTVPEQFRGRRFYQHNPNVTLMRTTPDENDQLGKEIAHKASAARGPTAVLVPRRGVSAIDVEGGPFWWPEADAALFDSLRLWMSPHVELIEVDRHINDPEFAALAVDTLRRLMSRAATAARP
ncbi:MAG: Tm-1-like ATP-binding domain-containing protein [Gemmataceae bacterium]|nr:Tm-1-like ATP-binding domain-containing protein [Gemmataceae bacterium]MDW8265203.1 Tm-1-like ATP-binding domain-containing protein [Gemmataceae bacterium]